MRELKLSLSAEDFERLIGGCELIVSVESYVRTGGRLVPGSAERVEARLILSDIGFTKMLELIGSAANANFEERLDQIRGKVVPGGNGEHFEGPDIIGKGEHGTTQELT